MADGRCFQKYGHARASVVRVYEVKNSGVRDRPLRSQGRQGLSQDKGVWPPTKGLGGGTTSRCACAWLGQASQTPVGPGQGTLWLPITCIKRA